MDPTPDPGPQPMDGVLVVRMVHGVADDRQVFRVTLGTGTDVEPSVKVVSGAAALHEMIDDWIASLGS